MSPPVAPFPAAPCPVAAALLCALAAAVAIAPSTASGQDDWQQAFKPLHLESDGARLNYRLLEPVVADSADAGAEKFPLVVFLHGAGERGDDNTAQLKHGVVEFFKRQQQHPCFVLVPQCPEGQKWVDTDWSKESGRNTFPEEPSTSMALVLKVVDELLQSGRVDPARVYVTGLSMGGYGTWWAAGAADSPFVAAAPICGGGDPEWAQRYVSMPLWAFHGDADTAVPVERSREMIEAIRAAGGEPKYTEYAGVGHDSWTRTYASDDFHEWLFSAR